TLGMAAVTFHHFYLGMFIDDPRMDEVLRVAAAYDRAVFVHILDGLPDEAPWRLRRLALRLPTVRFLALDGFSSGNQSISLTDWAPDVPNVWFDTACMSSVGHGLDQFIERCGTDRLVFGSDLYGKRLFYTAFGIAELQAMGLTTEDLKGIFSGNIRTLLRL